MQATITRTRTAALPAPPSRAVDWLMIGVACAYAVAVVWYAWGQSPLLDWDGPERGLFGAMLADGVRRMCHTPVLLWSDQWRAVLQQYHHQFEVGLDNVLLWTPLQAMGIFLVAFLGGMSEFAWGAVNLAFLAMLGVYVYRLTRLLSGQRAAARWSVVLLLWHPLVFDSAVSMLRGIGEAAFLLMLIYHGIRYARGGRGIHLWLTWTAWLLGVLYRESLVIVLGPLAAWTVWQVWQGRGVNRQRLWRDVPRSCRSLVVILAAALVGYAGLQWTMTPRGVGTLLTKLEAHARNDVPGPVASYHEWVTVHDYVRVMYGPLEQWSYAPAVWAALKTSDPQRFRKAQLIVHRVTISTAQKFVFLCTCVLYQWYLLPALVWGALLAVRRRWRGFGWLGWLSAGYVTLLVAYVVIPDYTVPLIACVAVCAGCGLADALGRLRRAAVRLAVVALVVVACSVSVLAYARIRPYRYYPPAAAVAAAILADAPAGQPLTILVDIWRRPTVALAFLQLAPQQPVYIRTFHSNLPAARMRELMQPGGTRYGSQRYGSYTVPQAHYLVLPHVDGMLTYLEQRYGRPLPFRLYQTMPHLDIFKRSDPS